jgi:hypothetical protein
MNILKNSGLAKNLRLAPHRLSQPRLQRHAFPEDFEVEFPADFEVHYGKDNRTYVESREEEKAGRGKREEGRGKREEGRGREEGGGRKREACLPGRFEVEFPADPDVHY